MRPLREFKYWLWGNRLAKKGMVALQHEQVGEHRELVKEVKKNRRMMLHEMADVVLRLEAVSDNLETALEKLREEPS